MSFQKQLQKINFLNILCLRRSLQKEILKIRNQKEIRKNLYTTHLIKENEHFLWLKNLKKNKKNLFFAIEFDNEIIGTLGLTDIDFVNKKASWQFHISKKKSNRGLGTLVEFKLLDFCFKKKNLNKLNCEVLEFNIPVIKLHTKFGFRKEGLRREHIIRKKKKYGVFLLGITKKEWVLKRKYFLNNI